jgi:hypothetical protein
MKKNLSLLLIYLFSVVFVHATVFRVNNSMPTDAAQKIYNNIQAAHDAAAAGDTLMIEGSTTNYAAVDLTKKLVIIGPGYFLSQNPQGPANSVQAISLGISIRPSASGTVVMGMTFATYSAAHTVLLYDNISNVTIMRCHFNSPICFYGQLQNITVIQNYFEGTPITWSSSAHIFSGVVLRNNIIGGQVLVDNTLQSQRNFNAIENNIFLSALLNLTAASFRSNIIVGTSGTTTISGPTQNNLFSNAQLPATDGNIKYDASKLFVGGTSEDGQYQLKSDSPYKSSGYNGTEPGVFGSAQPYVLSGIPPIPVIYELDVPSFGSKTTGLPVKLKVRTNP